MKKYLFIFEHDRHLECHLDNSDPTIDNMLASYYIGFNKVTSIDGNEYWVNLERVKVIKIEQIPVELPEKENIEVIDPEPVSNA